jgi:hypothetical protein
MKSYILSVILLVSLLFLGGCYYDVEEELYPASVNACDTAQVTYSLTIKPIIDQYCNSCHSAAIQQGSVILETHTALLAYVNSGQLLGAVKHQSGFSPMPQGGAKLSDCNILKIEKWVQSGAMND